MLFRSGESQEVRARRLRQYEDFFNPGGMATPDDTVTYGDTQIGYSATGFDWIDGYARGAASITHRGRYVSRNPKAGHHNIGFRCAAAPR